MSWRVLNMVLFLLSCVAQGYKKAARRRLFLYLFDFNLLPNHKFVFFQTLVERPNLIDTHALYLVGVAVFAGAFGAGAAAGFEGAAGVTSAVFW